MTSGSESIITFKEQPTIDCPIVGFNIHNNNNGQDYCNLMFPICIIILSVKIIN